MKQLLTLKQFQLSRFIKEFSHPVKMRLMLRRTVNCLQNHKKTFLFICGFIAFLPIFVMYEEYPNQQIRKITYNGNLPVLYRDIFPNKDDFNIYFTETSFRPTLHPKVLCSMESYCRVNPNATLWILLTSPSLEEETIANLKEMQKDCKIKYVATDVFLTLSGTPIEDLPNSFGFWRSSILYYNLSDLMRLAILFKSGGLYSDTDLLATQSLANQRNFLAATQLDISNFALHFDANHPYMEDVMIYIKNNFYRDVYTMSGPVPFTRVIQNWCPKESTHLSPTVIHQLPTIVKRYLEDMFTNTDSDYACENYENKTLTPKIDFVCRGVTVWKAEVFSPIHWLRWKDYFNKSPEGICLEKMLPRTFGFHLYGVFSAITKPSEGSALKKIHSITCPKQFKRTEGNIYQ